MRTHHVVERVSHLRAKRAVQLGSASAVHNLLGVVHMPTLSKITRAIRYVCRDYRPLQTLYYYDAPHAIRCDVAPKVQLLTLSHFTMCLMIAAACTNARTRHQVALCQTGRSEDLDEALVHHAFSLRVQETSYGPNHYRTAITLSNVALVNRLQGRVELALEQHLDATERMRIAFGKEEHFRIAVCYNNVGKVSQVNDAPQFYLLTF